MKKTALFALMSVVLLTGCDDSLTTLGPKTWVTMEEQGYIVATEAANSARGLIGMRDSPISQDSYRKIWWDFAKVLNKREKYNELQITKVKSEPFCDILNELKVADYVMSTKVRGAVTVAETYQSINGKSLREACGIKGTDIPIARTVDTGRTPNGEPELAPETYGLMIDAAKTCERARISLMAYPSGYVFTKNDYNKIMNLVNDCKRFELESSINSK